MTESACIFCRIVDGEAPAHIVWQDDEHVAFLDRNPVTDGHVLLIPRTHVTTIFDLDPTVYARLFERVRVLAPPVAEAASAPRTALAIEGYGVAHAHVHLVPVWGQESSTRANKHRLARTRSWRRRRACGPPLLR